MKGRKSGAVFIFIGLVLVVIFAVGLAGSRNPVAFHQKYRYDYALEQFFTFCVYWWLPAGILGIPTLLISLIVSLRREHKQNSQ